MDHHTLRSPAIWFISVARVTAVFFIAIFIFFALGHLNVFEWVERKGIDDKLSNTSTGTALCAAVTTHVDFIIPSSIKNIFNLLEEYQPAHCYL